MTVPDPDQAPQPAPPAGRPRWLWGYLVPHWRLLGTGSATMALRAGVLALVPWPLKFIIDTVIGTKPLPASLQPLLPDVQAHRLELLAVLCLLTLALGLADAVLDYSGSRLFLEAGQRLVFNLRHDLFAHLQRLSLGFHRRHRGGDLMSRISGDVQKLQDLVTAVGGDLIQSILTMIGISAVMLSVDWRYALVVLGTVPFLFIIIQIYTRLLRRAVRQVRHHEGELWSQTQEVLGGVQLVQAYGRERHEEHRFATVARRIFQAGRDANNIQAQFSPAMTLAVAGATGLIAWFGAVRVLDGRITAGELIVFLAYFRSLTAPTRRIAKIARVIGRASVAIERIGDYLLEQPAVSEPPLALVPSHSAGLVRFENVRFGYGAEGDVLADVSFTLTPGTTVALVGTTGAGKSTIAGLISRFYDPTGGRILLDGHDLRSLSLTYLRRQIALVLQEPVIFHATIWENICYGLEGTGREDAIAAATAIGVDEVIAHLPGGYDCIVSERGQTLSGGQRQCISLARAMLSEAPVVILDEPSSNLDAVTEQRLMSAVKRLTATRTALVIAHRLRSVVDADEILVLDHGRIVQRGSHARMLRDGGLYAQLWRSLAGADDAPEDQADDGAPPLRSA